MSHFFKEEIEEMESYLAKELEFKLKFEELQKDIIELKAQIKQKDLAIQSLVAREKELDKNIAEKDARIRSQAHEIGRRKADSFKKANHRLFH